jgi:hypothetical protein
MTVLESLKEQRWNDYRYDRYSRINQSLHLLSATSFLCAYIMMFKDPAAASLTGWLVAMSARQIGVIFFEPRGNDSTSQVAPTGYTVKQKNILLVISALSPILLLVEPTLFGMLRPPHDLNEVVRAIGYMWLALGGGAILFRALYLVFARDIQTALVWIIKLLTDPFHDIKLYYRAPAYLLRGELLTDAAE